MLVAGIDEAGRGPAIGPLVLAVVVVRKEDEEKLKKIGVRDSKLLSAKQRTLQEKKIKRAVAEFGTVQITAQEIDELRDRKSLNEIEAMRAGLLLNNLKQKPCLVYVDSPDPEEKNFEKRIRKYIDFECAIVSEHKADANYPVVSAASILAKTERDREIQKLERIYGRIGSGYSHDPTTINFLKNWLEKNKGMPDFARKSWQTTKDMLDRRFQKKVSEW